MNGFNHFSPTEIVFGCGRINEIAQLAARYGSRALLVTESMEGPLAPTFARIKSLLEDGNIQVEQFDGVIPNPTTDVVTRGADMAKDFGAQVVIGVGGGSSMDTANPALMRLRASTRYQAMRFV